MSNATRLICRTCRITRGKHLQQASIYLFEFVWFFKPQEDSFRNNQNLFSFFPKYQHTLSFKAQLSMFWNLKSDKTTPLMQRMFRTRSPSARTGSTFPVPGKAQTRAPPEKELWVSLGQFPLSKPELPLTQLPLPSIQEHT